MTHSLVRLASLVSLIFQIEGAKDHLSVLHPDRRNLKDCSLDEAFIGSVSVEIENNSPNPFVGSVWLDDLDPNTENPVWEAQLADPYQDEMYPFEYIHFKNACLDQSRCYRIKIENPHNGDDTLHSMWTKIKYNGEIIMTGPIGQLLHSPLFGEGCDCQIPKQLRIETSEVSDKISWTLREFNKTLWKADEMNLLAQTDFNFTYLICYERCYQYDWGDFNSILYLDETLKWGSTDLSISNYLLGNACANSSPSKSPSSTQVRSILPSPCNDIELDGRVWHDSDGKKVRFKKNFQE